INRIEYDYPSFHLSMDCFWCEIADGEIVLKEAESARWLKPDELYSVNWLSADRILVDAIAEHLARDSGVILH
ncbi:MAG TPA: 8-oxo-dGTP diphosphatase MutT, partial [Candidatus Lachnoclostridium stercoravium]|nr:8-oxo-dGTP diphosphatase MutT [Candidatus Lachnoclostridium stercoravium]